MAHPFLLDERRRYVSVKALQNANAMVVNKTLPCEICGVNGGSKSTPMVLGPELWGIANSAQGKFTPHS
jgi:hypothetical protein